MDLPLDTIDTSKTAVLNWFGQAEWKEKYAFMRSLFGSASPQEVKVFENMCNKTRRVNKRKGFEAEATSKKARVESVPTEPVPPEQLKGWWTVYKKDEVVSIDCEHVHLIGIEGSDRIKAGEVSIYNARREEIYNAKIRREPKSFIVNRHTKSKNGYNENSLAFERPISEVKKELEELLAGKLIISFQGATDIKSLDLDDGDYDHFDLAEFYKRPKPNKRGEDYGEKISLRTLCYHFFKTDIQSGVHLAKIDAKSTMDLFLDHYCKIPEVKTNRYYKNFDMFEDIKKYDP